MPNGGPEHPGTSVEHLGAIADKLGVERDDVENHGKLVEHLWEHLLRGQALRAHLRA